MRSLLTLIVVFVMSGCATGQTLAAPAPSPEQVQSVRVLTLRALEGADAALTLSQQAGVMLNALPVSNEIKNGYDCALAKTFGTTQPASPAVVAVCGAIPVTNDAPFAKAVNELRAVTTCPGLMTSAGRVSALIDPLLAKLESAGNQAATFAVVAVRSALGFIRALNAGGVACS